MAIFYKTSLSECETYEEFKEIIGDFGHTTNTFKQDGSYDVSEYSKVFKGFDPDVYYCAIEKNSPYFLRNVCYYDLILFTRPEFNAKNKTVTFFESNEKREKGVRSNPTKMGKFFRKIAPYFNDKQIEFLVNYTVDYFTDSIYTHHIAKGKDISNIYLSKTESGRDIGKYSCINASCMRHNNWEIHPTEVYGTDSWELHYLTNEDGDIGARALVCRDDNAYNYIYASCEHAGKTLEHELKDLGFVDCDEVRYAFKGAKLLKIEGNGGLVAPYIDHHCEVKDCGEHLEIAYSYADYSFNSTLGYVDYKVTYDCEECGCECDEEDMISVDGYLYCADCVFFCNHSHKYVVGEPIKVYCSVYGYSNVCEDALEDMGAVYNEYEDQWQTPEWYEECTKKDEENEEDDKEDTEIKIQPKKEIKVGVKCVVVGGYNTFHFFSVGTVVEVVKWGREGVWDCRCVKSRIYQNIEAKDLVIAE